MSGSIPIKFQELFKLPNLGIAPAAISFNTVTMESDKYICVREQQGDASQICIIETANQQVIRQRINADSAIMHPQSKVLALKSGTTLQIFNLEMKAKMKSHTTQEQVVFWKWISVSMLALVTPTAVFHWSMEGDSAPKKVFDRQPALEGSSIINYRTDSSGQWCMLIGLGRNEDGSAKGVLQLYSMEKKVSQVVDGHACAFSDFKHVGTNFSSTLACIAVNKPDGGKLYVMEVPTNKPAGAPMFNKVMVSINFAAGDFPVAMQVSDRHGVIYMISRLGTLYMFDVETGALLFSNRISTETIFVTAPFTANNGVIGINRVGQVLTIAVDDNNLVPYVKGTLNNLDLAIRLAKRADLPGADDVFVGQFSRLLQEGRIQEAIQMAISAPGGILRNQQTLERLQQVPAQPGQPPAISLYFKTLIDSSNLNAFESVEVAKLFLAKGGVAQLQSLFDQNKLECSEALGDITRGYDKDLALKIYVKGSAHAKVIGLLAEKGQLDKIPAYSQKFNYTPDYPQIILGLIGINPDGAVALAKLAAQNDPNLNIDGIVNVFVQRTMIPQVTDFLLDVLKGDRPTQAALQTRLIETNLMYSPPQVADRILGSGMFSQYDKQRIAALCEKAGLFHRALENYKELNDIRRVVVHAPQMDPQFVITFFGNLSSEEALTCLQELLRSNMRANASLVTQIASRYATQLTPKSLIELLEKFKCYDGLFYFLGSQVPTSTDAEIHFKYIEAAFRVGNFAEVERMTRESNVYDAERTKQFLKENRMPDMWPFINVCDKYDFVEEMVQFLFQSNQLKFIDAFCITRNPLRTPAVVGALIDLDAREDYIRNLILSVGNMCPVDPLVEEVEKRNRMKLLLGWLEARLNEGSQEVSLHNALAKVYIDLNKDAAKFLESNQYYDSRVVGKYCEKRDPHLAFIAYKRGQCDYELVDVCNKNSMFRQEARYLVERQNEDLWAVVLSDENKNRRSVIDAVVQYALPESNNPEEVSNTVKAFMAADLPNELIGLLEKIVLQGNSEFKKNHNLQNLLILTAIKADQSRVMDFINRLDNYDAQSIAFVATKNELFEEAFAIYKKFSHHAEAVTVLLENMHNIDRAVEYAERVDQAEVWSLVAKAQLETPGFVSASIDSFLRADDASCYLQVIEVAQQEGAFEKLVEFLRMARKKMKDSHVDSELVYSMARANMLAELEEFVSAPNVAKIQQIGDRCFDAKFYEAAKILFTAIGNHSRLASALVKLGQFQNAVEAARKANSTRTWKEVCFACVDAEEFALARTCGLNIIIHADELEELCWHYEKRGHFEHLMALLEAGVPSDRVHMGIFTELGRLYSRYKPAKLMEFIKVNWAKSNIPRLIRACELDHHWAELRFLHSHYDEYDNAVRVMMEHPTEAFDHAIMKELITQCKNPEMPHKAVDFYLNHVPLQVNDLLMVLAHDKIDQNRVVQDVKRFGQLSLIKGFMEAVQDLNTATINEALNSLYIEEEDFAMLRQSISKFDKFDAIGLAQKLEKHDLLEFRRVAAELYKRTNRWKQSVELSKRDKLYRDAMETAAASKDTAIAEDLVSYFVDQNLTSCFVAALFTCYDLLRADVVLELAWSKKLMDFAMPYLVQVIREYTSRVDVLHKEREERLEKEKKVKEGEEEAQYAPAAANPIPALLAMQATGMLAMQPTGMLGMQPTGMAMGYGMEAAPLQFMATGAIGYGGMPGYGMGQPY
eukprot:ANDGO_05236.mRNA.1 Clathrin heavy chain